MTPDSSRTSDLPTERRPRSSRPEPLLPLDRAPDFTLDLASRSDIGRQRDRNEDSLLVTSSAPAAHPDLAPPGWTLLTVCDGMGGARGGQIASQLAASILGETMERGGPASDHDELDRRLLHAVEEASRRIHEQATATSALAGMGSTATACVVQGDRLTIAQVGDSRAYLLREGRLTQLTRDQTLATLMLESGQLAPEDVDDFPFNHVILQAVGTAARVDVDLRRVQVNRGDTLLICSDGLHGPVPHEKIRRTLHEAPTAAVACESLIAQAIEAGGPDNVTVIVARLEGASLPPPTEEVQVEKAIFAPDLPTLPSAPAPLPVDEAPESPTPPSSLPRLRDYFSR